MVLRLDSSLPGATVFESSSLASTHSLVASLSTKEASNLVLKGRSRNIFSKVDISCSWFSLLNHKFKRTSKYLYQPRAEIAKKHPLSVFNSDIFEVIRRRTRSLASAVVSDGASNEVLQSDHENAEEVKKIRHHSDPKGPTQLPLSTWKHNLWQYLEASPSSFDAPPQTPVPPFTGGLMSLIGLVVICGAILDRWVWRTSRKGQKINVRNVVSEDPCSQLSSAAVFMFLQKDLQTKESVEWVNMVLGKLWKLYRVGLESLLVGLLQPLIDILQKPLYVESIQIKQFYLGEEPVALKSVQRRASPHSNDLQYNVQVRYSGGARMLLSLKLTAGFLPFTVPVGVRNLDVDGELWVKLRLVPAQPWVGATTWAFVSLPKIELDLSPFRLFDIMAIPFLSVFLTKLLTEDLPKLFVLPKKISINFLKERATGSVPQDFKGAKSGANKDFSGELSVTLVDARKLIYVPYETFLSSTGKSDPYVLFTLGDQLKQSKRNSQTSFYGPPGSPTWNQDFQFLVVDSKAVHLKVIVRDYFGLTAINIGAAEVDLSGLQDTVPFDKVIKLRGGWGPFKKLYTGELLLRLTYTAYVEEDDEEDGCEGTPDPSPNGYLTEADENDTDEVPLFREIVNKAVETAEREPSVPNVFTAAIAELDKEIAQDGMTGKNGSDGIGLKSAGRKDKAKSSAFAADEMERSEIRTGLLWLALVTVLVVLVDRSVNFSNFMNP